MRVKLAVRCWFSGVGLLVIAFSSAQTLSLSEALRYARGHREAILSAENRLRSAEAMRSSLGAYLPTRLEFGDGTHPDNTAGGEDLLLAQPIDLFGRVSASRSSGNAGVLAAQAAFAQAKLDVQSEVIQAFAAAYSDQEMVRSAEASDAIARQLYDATKKRVDIGDLAPSQLLRADLERERSAQTLIVRRLGLRGSLAKLRAAMGQTSMLGSVGTDLGLEVPGRLNVNKRPDLLAAESEVRAANSEVRLADLDNYPTLELQFRRAPWGTPEGYAARVQMVWPIWDHGAAHQRSMASKLNRLAAEQALRDKRKKAEAELVEAQNDYRAAVAARDSFEKLVADARGLLEKEQRGYTLGAASLLEVLDASRSLREIEEGAIDARSKVALAGATLLAAAGEEVK